MANNYLQFSAQLPFDEDPEKREAQREWMTNVLTAADDGTRDLGPNDTNAADAIAGRLKELGFDIKDDDGELEWWPHFMASVEEDGVWIYAEEYGDVENVGRVVQAFLAKFRPSDVWTMTWSETCSRMRLDEFGGGALVVSAKRYETRSSSSVAGELFYELREEVLGG